MKKYNIAILGASGVVGIEMIDCLSKVGISIDKLVLLGSKRSAGKILNTPFGNIQIQEVNNNSFIGIDYALFSAGGKISKIYTPIANNSGAIVIDNSSEFRYEKNIPLVVSEINSNELKNAKIIANPNCTTAIAAIVLWPIYKKYGIKKIIMSTYQATSGGGANAMKELLNTTGDYLAGKNVKNKIFSHPIAFNLIPHIDGFQKNGYTKEEMKVSWELKKIFGNSNIKISCTAVRIPTIRAHSESITIETEKDISSEKVKQLMKSTPGVELTDDINNNIYPMPINATGKHNVEVGRIRNSLVFGKKGIDLFISGDQLLKGAALNAIQILNKLISNNKINL